MDIQWHEFLEKKGQDVKLTPQEINILKYCVPHSKPLPSNNDAARKFSIECSTVKEHFTEIYDKFCTVYPEFKNLPKGVRKREELHRLLSEDFERLPKAFGVTDPHIQKVAELLSKFDYEEQATSFSKLSSRFFSIGAFVISAEEKVIQQWMIKRLISRISRFQPGGEIMIDFHKNRIRFDCERLWSILGHSLGITAPYSREEILENLYNKLKERPLILVVSRIETSPKACELFSDFWEELVQRITVRKKNYQESLHGLFLFLPGQEETLARVQSFRFVEEKNIVNPGTPVLLPYLTSIEPSYIQGWLQDNQEKYVEHLSRLHQGQDVQDVVDKFIGKVASWKDKDLCWILNHICEELGCPNGINDVERYWSLSA